jgi:hypothetical protein
MTKIRMILAALCAALALSSAALASNAYIDDQTGIVVAMGQAALASGESYETARRRAVDDARNNMLILVQKQYVDMDSMTVGQFVTRNPDKRAVVDRYIGTARVFNETQEGATVKVTLLLPYYGPSGYQGMIAEITGKEPPAAPEGKGAEITPAERETFVARSPEQVGEPYRIAMLTFENASGYQALALDEIFTDMLRELFKKDRRFVFLSEQETMEVLQENRLTPAAVRASGVTDSLKVEGVDGLVSGRIVRYEPHVKKHGIGGAGYLEMNFDMEIELHVLDARKSKWVVYDLLKANMNERTFTLKSADDAEKFIAASDIRSTEGLAGRAVRKMLSQVDAAVRGAFPLEGYVLKVVSDWVYVNLTSIDGIREGDVLTVYRVGDLLVDPITGKTVDRIQDRIATIEIVDVKESYSQARAKDLFGLKIQPGDIVMLK